ncbi:Ion transport protein-domain-containing protein [Lobosporangium transversale]|uniref:Calcium-channel protein CCH1 n=1 Tax=Lobosporangium transversale TaxID=64571 RepID=A0A1Y2GAF9_9FUNG|nr:Ion transport protein-domain-containing protein [Lobosporangium transversale]ORZ05510.1 Ion transport protein-domain-containing protein [Lobosporangium transversale]|eukprot:XP_021877084.1 Ion transport protein-domain-containing protein [Lobosporangium transversale]
MALGRGQGYQTLRNASNTTNDSSSEGLSPQVSNPQSRSNAWTSLTRMVSDRSIQNDFELNPVNDRTGLTANMARSSMSPSLQDSQEDLLTGGDPSSNVHLQPLGNSPRRHRGFHNNPSLANNKSSRSTSSKPGSRLASMKQVLGRASTRVINSSISSRDQQPSVPEIPTIFIRRSTDDLQQQQQQYSSQDYNLGLDQDQRQGLDARVSSDNLQQNDARKSRTSLSPLPEVAYAQPLPEVAYAQPLPDEVPPIDPTLEGKSLFIFGPDNAFRKKLNKFLNQIWVELFLLLLLILNLVFLIVTVSSPVGQDTVWGAHWTDYGLFIIFVLYTLEIGARIIVNGLVLYPKDGEKVRKLLGKKPRTDNLHDTNPTILRKERTMALAQAQAQAKGSGQNPIIGITSAPTFRQTEQSSMLSPIQDRPGGRATTIIDFAVGRQTTMTQYIPTYLDPLIAYRPQFVVVKKQIPFLRHTFNRIDMVAVICYWIDFTLMLSGVHDVYFFKTIAAMRTLRLLNITSGSSTILHSLKKSAPLLVNVVLFIAFFFIIFSIIGVQAFKGSFSRRCVSATNETDVLDQFCGGHYSESNPLAIEPYITLNNVSSPTLPKGNICSHGYICKDTGENYHKTVSFDTIYSAMVPVYILMTGQTWTDMMYRIMDAEYGWSSIYFVLVVLVMNFWILNLFVAVINEMFAKIRDDSANNSAFKSEDSYDNKNEILSESVNNFTYSANNLFSRRKHWIAGTEFIWVAAVVVDLVFQCMPRYNDSYEKAQRYERIEFWFTIGFALEILFRFLVFLPVPKEFFKSKKNQVDLFLAVVTMIIQIPPIHNSRAYVYLTVFQVFRIYRPIIYVERLKSLIQRVVGSWIGLLNLIFFIALFLGVVSVMAGILFREIINPTSTSMNFSDFYVSYLGMYQLFSGENWTEILYSVMSAEILYGQVFIATVFIIAFYSFANFVLVNMLIAIIMENFEGEAEVAKHAQQILDFAARSGYSREEERKFVIYLTKYLKPYPKSIGVDGMQSGWIIRMRKGLARQFLLGDNELFHGYEKDPLLESNHPKKKAQHFQHRHHHRRASSLKSVDFGFAPRYGPLNQDEIDNTEQFRQLYSARVPGYANVDDNGQEAPAVPQATTIKKQKSFSTEALRHRSLLIFGPENKFRRFLQRIVTPGRGYRIEGAHENVMLSRPFNLFITLAILACVAVAVITTPAWRFHQAELPPEQQSVVVPISDFVFPAIFTVEFLIRIIADGFIFPPDAYMKTLWNKIDFFVLLSFYAPLVANLTNSQGSSRFFRSLKALRALRLINQSAYIKGTFHAVLVAGFPQLFNATLLSMSLIVPFAIYGMRMFSGLFYSCNDTSDDIRTMNDCVGTFLDPHTKLLKPRVWSNPEVYSFDNFGASFLILLEIVSQEGWSGVMETARNIVGLGMQPSQDYSRYNGIFFVLFNLSGGYFVTSLFVAIVIENYTKRTGTAFMTANQRRWMDLKKLLGSIKMKKAKRDPPANPIKAFCFRLVAPKKGWFPRLIAVITVLNGILLATEHVNSGDWEGLKNWIFLALLSIYMIEIFVKICGLGWSAFRKNKWNIYNSTVSILALLITVVRISGATWQPLVQTQKLLLTAILFRLVPQSDSLNQLFTTMAASIGSISSLLGVWLVVFAVYGIMFVEIFGLTSYGSNGSEHVNFRNIGTSLLMMARMSTGEGWNDLMHDFAVEKPSCVNKPENYLLSDCGSTPWSYTLFISFNIISMYIFTNMFIVVVMHNFSYVYQIAPGFSLINREEIRGFKRVWSEVDTEHTGYIRAKDLAMFLSKLRGVFDMRIYNEEHSIIKLQSKLETVKPNFVKLSARDLEKNAAAAGPNSPRKVLMLNQTNRRSTHFNWDDEKNGKKPLSGPISVPISSPLSSPPQPYHQSNHPNLAYKLEQDYNLAAFNSAIANLDRADVRRRRRLYNFLYVEALMSMEPIPGSETRKKKSFFSRWRRSPSSGGSDGVGEPSSTATTTAAVTAHRDYEMEEIGGERGEAEPEKGISFQKMLHILAHYKLIEDDQCLSIGDMLRHRQKMDRIHARINVITVKSTLLRIILRRRFLKHFNAVKKIRSRIDDSQEGDDEGRPHYSSSGVSASASASAGTTSASRHAGSSGSVQEQEGRGGTSSSDQKRVRICTDDAQSSSGAAGVGSGTGASFVSGGSGGDKSAVEFDDTINPEQAGALIDGLRSEWRSFISNNELSMDNGIEDTGLEATQNLSLNDFEHLSASADLPRNDVLGRDYL